MSNVYLDLDRQQRCGFSEVIYGEGKTAETLLHIFQQFAEKNVDTLATRVSVDKAEYLRAALRGTIRHNSVAGTFRLMNHETERPAFSGKVVIVSAGTSDAQVAEEAYETVLWTGADAELIQDIGVAGPQRLQSKLPQIQQADVVIAVAGMEGALPSVIGGYVSVPVIAVPSSVGYGANFGGLTALLGMLNSCAANVVVVNIDAGFKAGYAAGLMLKGRISR